MPEKLLRYEKASDVERRLHGCVVRYLKEPVICSADGLHVVTKHLITGKQKKVHSSDPELDISSVPLGNLNQGGAFYTMRPTSRTQHQGVSPGYCRFFSRKGFIPMNVELAPFGKMVLGDYPDIDEVVKDYKAWKAPPELFSAAFNRYFSLFGTEKSGVLILRHLTFDIGFFLPSDKAVIVTAGLDDTMLGKVTKFMESKSVETVVSR